jgi:hypothetical protein
MLAHHVVAVSTFGRVAMFDFADKAYLKSPNDFRRLVLRLLIYLSDQKAEGFDRHLIPRLQHEHTQACAERDAALAKSRQLRNQL